MAHIDKVKEEIGWLKVVFAVFLATALSLIAWLVENYGKGQTLLLVVGGVAAFLIMLAIIWINSVAKRKINKLEEL
jgi:4-hydroxybenzoate polyprenyltransferase